MFAKKSNCNMTKTDSYIRLVVATIILILSITYDCYLSAIVSIIIYYSAFTKFCFMYSLFKINDRFSLKNYYITQLPKYNNSATFIFEKGGRMMYRNSTAESDFAQIRDIYDFHIKDCKSIVQNSSFVEILYEHNAKTYQIHLQGIEEDKVVLVYVNDVTTILELNDEIEETQREVIYAMGEIGETRSKETGNHVKRVALYSEKLALLYGLSIQEAELLKTASPMHDIGKVAIADAILNAPRKLSEEEFEVMKTHAQLGSEMLNKSNKPILKAASIVAGEHHEKYDGSGYPKGLKGEEIHIYGRITAVADVFDALGSERVYKKAWELEDILTYFNEQSAKHFDPQLVKLFLENLDEFLVIRESYKD